MLAFIVVILLEVLAGAEVDLFVPSLPDLQRDFGLSPFLVELTLVVNLIPYCVMALVAGTLGDKYGRKPIILSGLVLFILGSVICLVANTYWQLLCGRVLQGVGIAGPAVLAYVVIADLFSQARQQELVGILHGVITLAMAMAPLMGSYINLYFHWRGNFAFLLIFGCFVFFASLILPYGKTQPDLAISFKEYVPIIRSKRLWLYTLPVSFVLTAYWVFIGVSPILYMEDFNVSLAHFGYYQGAMAGAMAITSLMSGMLFRRYGQKNCFYTSVGILAIFVLACVSLVLFKVTNPLIITSVLLLLSVGFVGPTNILWPLSLDVVPNAKGRISAFAVAIKMILTAIGVQLVSYFYDHSFFGIGLLMIVSVSFGLWVGYLLLKEDKIFD